MDTEEGEKVNPAQQRVEKVQAFMDSVAQASEGNKTRDDKNETQLISKQEGVMRFISPVKTLMEREGQTVAGHNPKQGFDYLKQLGHAYDRLMASELPESELHALCDLFLTAIAYAVSMDHDLPAAYRECLRARRAGEQPDLGEHVGY
jgi:hypothetical protein